MTLHIHRAAARGRAGARAGCAAGHASRGPVHPRRRRGAVQGRRAVDHADAGGVGLGTSTGDGVCANVLFPSPARVVADALAVGTGVDARDDPWAEHRLAWVLLDVVERCAAEPWCATLGRHLGLLDGQSRPGPSGGGGAEARRAVHRVRRAAAGHAARLGGRTRHRRVRASRSTTTWCGRPSCGDGCGPRSARRAPPSGSTPACDRLRVEPDDGGPARRGCRCSGRPG